MNNLHQPVMLNEVKSFIPIDKKINLIDATFGGGGYSRSILHEFNIKNLVAFDRDPISKLFAKEIKKQFNNFELFCEKFSNLESIISQSQFSNEKFEG